MMNSQLAPRIEQEFSVQANKVFRNHVARNSFLVRYRQASFGRQQVERFIAKEYREHFDAELREFMPTLVGLHDERGTLKAAVGYRAAAAERLFLETYTGRPIEEVVAALSGQAVERREIAEVGSLACHSGRAAMEIVTALVPALIEDGFSWVVFTGADTVRNVFRRLALKPISLCIANKSLLGDKQQEWGTYYDHNPVVMAGRLADGIVALEPVAGVQ